MYVFLMGPNKSKLRPTKTNGKVQRMQEEDWGRGLGINAFLFENFAK